MTGSKNDPVDAKVGRRRNCSIGAFSVIVKTDGSFAALVPVLQGSTPGRCCAACWGSASGSSTCGAQTSPSPTTSSPAASPDTSTCPRCSHVSRATCPCSVSSSYFLCDIFLIYFYKFSKVWPDKTIELHKLLAASKMTLNI